MPFDQSAFDQRLVDMLFTTARPGQYAARNAVRHLDNAERIADIDPEMAAFRAITAEAPKIAQRFPQVMVFHRREYLIHERLQNRENGRAQAAFLAAEGYTRSIRWREPGTIIEIMRAAKTEV